MITYLRKRLLGEPPQVLVDRGSVIAAVAQLKQQPLGLAFNEPRNLLDPTADTYGHLQADRHEHIVSRLDTYV